jgi:hypothetical protein
MRSRQPLVISARFMIAVLAALVQVSWTPTGLYVALHTGDPGADGTANQSAVTARSELLWGTPAKTSRSTV